MKAKKLLFYSALLIVFLLLGCSNDDSYSGSGTSQNPGSVVTVPNSPLGDRMQVLPIGATINQINVIGENIKWYELNQPPKIDFDEPFLLIGDDEAIVRTLLSPNTILQNKTTYYATQTIDNVESKAYLPVTVELRRFVR